MQRRGSSVALFGLAGVVAMVALLLFAGSGDGRTNDASTPRSTVPTTALPSEQAVVDWHDDDGAVSFDGGWRVGSVQGDAPLLQVELNGATVGTIEAIAFPVDSFDGGADLDAMVADYYADIGSDRRKGCGYEIETAAPRPSLVGGRQGIAYGFRGPGERTMAFAAVVEDHVVLLTASAHDEDGCIGVEEVVFSTTTLAQFAPLFERIARDTPLPVDLVVSR